MINTLQILRKVGFFNAFSQLNDEDLLAAIHEKRKKAYSKIFGYEYEPERTLSDHKLAIQDTGKMLYMDLEADVCKENKVYIDLLQTVDKISGRKELLTNIEEEWHDETGPIMIRCRINGEPKEYYPEYSDDWVDQVIVEKILADVANVIQEEFLLCLGPDLDWFGQDVNYIRLKPAEREILQKQLGWKFYDDFLAEMNS